MVNMFFPVPGQQIQGSEIYLARVKPEIALVNEKRLGNGLVCQYIGISVDSWFEDWEFPKNHHRRRRRHHHHHHRNHQLFM